MAPDSRRGVSTSSQPVIRPCVSRTCQGSRPAPQYTRCGAEPLRSMPVITAGSACCCADATRRPGAWRGPMPWRATTGSGASQYSRFADFPTESFTRAFCKSPGKACPRCAQLHRLRVGVQDSEVQALAACVKVTRRSLPPTRGCPRPCSPPPRWALIRDQRQAGQDVPCSRKDKAKDRGGAVSSGDEVWHVFQVLGRELATFLRGERLAAAPPWGDQQKLQKFGETDRDQCRTPLRVCAQKGTILGVLPAKEEGAPGSVTGGSLQRSAGC